MFIALSLSLNNCFADFSIHEIYSRYTYIVHIGILPQLKTNTGERDDDVSHSHAIRNQRLTASALVLLSLGSQQQIARSGENSKELPTTRYRIYFIMKRPLIIHAAQHHHPDDEIYRALAAFVFLCKFKIKIIAPGFEIDSISEPKKTHKKIFWKHFFSSAIPLHRASGQSPECFFLYFCCLIKKTIIYFRSHQKKEPANYKLHMSRFGAIV